MLTHGFRVAAVAAIPFAVAQAASAQLTIVSQFSPGQGTLVSAAYDPITDRVWTYDNFGVVLRRYTAAGVPEGTIDQPGSAADDADLFVTPAAFTLGTTALPAGTLLHINGESGVAEIYAVDQAGGAVLATLATGFGVSHVVGGGYHPLRGTIFLVQDRQPSDPAQRSLIAEIDPITGAVRNTFGTGSATWTVNYGDLEVHPANGNLYLVSSDESSIRVLDPTGAFVAEFALPGGVSGLSGIGIDHVRGEAWVTSTTGPVYRLGGLAPPVCPGDVDGNGSVGLEDVAAIILCWSEPSTCNPNADLDFTGQIGLGDVAIVIQHWGESCL